MWIFGYGSLLWYTNFPYEKCVYGRLKGFARRFWQKSPDHRGTTQFPGRTVTLIADQNEEVWGVAYKVSDEDAPAVRGYLDHREKAGYNMQSVTFHVDDSQPCACAHAQGLPPGASIQIYVYISPQSDLNVHFAGPEPIEQIAQTIVRAKGKSGTNIEYLLRLAYHVKNKRSSSLAHLDATSTTSPTVDDDNDDNQADNRTHGRALATSLETSIKNDGALRRSTERSLVSPRPAEGIVNNDDKHRLLDTPLEKRENAPIQSSDREDATSERQNQQEKHQGHQQPAENDDTIDEEDRHLFELERAVLALCQRLTITDACFGELGIRLRHSA